MSLENKRLADLSWVGLFVTLNLKQNVPKGGKADLHDHTWSVQGNQQG